MIARYLILAGLAAAATACGGSETPATSTANTLGAAPQSSATEWQTTPSGIRYRRISGTGTGPKPSPTDTVTIHYVGKLMDGTEFDSSFRSGQPITMDDILSQTAMTYPEVYLQSMSGEQIKSILEDICDNLFNLDPYYQQGGDMVRIGGMSYTCAPSEATGKRISDMKLGGVALDPAKSYKVAGWASVNEQKGKPVWETVADYLRDTKPKPKSAGSQVKIVGVEDNPGYAGQT